MGVFELIIELRPRACITAVGDGELYVFRQIGVAAHQGDGGAAHRHAVQDYLNITAEGIVNKLEPLHTVSRLMRAEADIFALALAVSLMVDDKDVKAEVMIELCHEPEFALAPAAIAVACKDIDIGRLVRLQKITLELISIRIGYGVIFKGLLIEPLLAGIGKELFGICLHHLLFTSASIFPGILLFEL